MPNKTLKDFGRRSQPQAKPITDRVDRASATETVDSGSIPDRVKPKTTKICTHSFPV